MEPVVNPQPLGKVAPGQQRLAQHGREENGRGVVVPVPGYLDRQLDPVGRACSTSSARFGHAVLFGFCSPITAWTQPLGFRAVPCPRLLDLGLDADDCLGPVGEADARAAVRAGQDARLGDERAELGRQAAVGADGGRQGEGGVEVG